MTVKEIFELRKQGRIEEAYEAIRPMYAVHQGKYTTLCMFWTANDILKKRIKERRLDEAEKIFKALLRVLLNIEDKDGKALSSILYDAVTLDKESKSFCMLDFVEQLKVEKLSDEDWKDLTPCPSPNGEGSKYTIPSVAQQMLTCAFHELQEQMYGDFMTKKAPLSHDEVMASSLKVMPLLQEAMRRNPRDKHNQRYIAVVYTIMGERDKAVDIYHHLLKRSHDSYLYAELAELTDDPGQKAALYCQAIQNQRQEKFRTGYRLELAQLLIERDKPRAAHELQKCVATRKALGYHNTRDIELMLQQVAGIQPTTDAEQQDFYRKMTEKYRN
ncbi:tetratricopeptide repeat protein [Prevotella sp. E13-27]|uniref:tetratricopeptide repeat protein n=1 Tax=Prevotella sp. E13-27 TaxID=2938122 RepID=UPI00200AFEA1|nr:acetyltransferase [Prevotella sp. E13-27]MCK8623580.1 acetyltransferase [Prevotella sp. E13-27]